MQSDRKPNAMQDPRGEIFQLAKDNASQAGILRHVGSDRSLAVLVLVVAAAAAWFGKDIESASMGSEFAPGPQCFPLSLAAILGGWGLVALIRSFVMAAVVKRKLAALSDDGQNGNVATVAGPRAAAGPPSGDGSYVADAESVSIWPALLLMAALSVYTLAIGLIGFSLSTVIFATAMIHWLGARNHRPDQPAVLAWPLRLLLALGVSVLLVVAVRVLFVLFFQVQLPTGMLGIPF